MAEESKKTDELKMPKQYPLFLISKFTDTWEREKNPSIPYNSIFDDVKKDVEIIRSALSDKPDVLGGEEDDFTDTLYQIDEALMECVVEAKRRREAAQKRKAVGINCVRLYTGPARQGMDVCGFKKRNLKNSLLLSKEKIHNFRENLKKTGWTGKQPGKEDKPIRKESGIEQKSEWTSSVFDETKIYGWDKEVRDIFNDLQRNEEDLNTVGIVGMFGSGKTKLAQKVFADGVVMDRFSLRLWVWVSKDCRPENLLRRMLDNLGVEEEEIENALEVAKQDKLAVEGVLLFLLHLQLLDKRYLIVFDDVRKTDAWYSNLYLPAPYDRQWDRLAHGLPKGSGGAIIVTSRCEDDARRMVGRGAIYKPKPLSMEDGWKVFKEAYEAEGKKESLELLKMPDWEKLKEMITEKCAGLPFALRVAGREWSWSEKKKEEKAADDEGEKEKKAKRADDEKEKDEEQKKDEQDVKEEMAPGEKKEEKATGKEPLPPPPPEVKKDEEGVKKEMVPGEKQEEKPRTGDEKGEEKEPPPPPVAEKKDKEDVKDMSPREKQEEKPEGGDGKEKGKELPPPVEGKKDKEAMQKETSPGDEKDKGKEPPPPLEEKEKEKEPAATQLKEKTDKEAMQKETSTGDEKEKGKEPAAPSLGEKKDKEAMQKETTTGAEKKKDKEPAAPPLEEKKEKEAILQKATSTGNEKEKSKEPAAHPPEEKKDKEDIQKATSTGDDEKEKGKEPAATPPDQEKKDKEAMQKETPHETETGEGKPASDEKEKGE